MRAAVLASVFLLATSAAVAEPPFLPDRKGARLTLPSQDDLVRRYRAPRPDSAMLGPPAGRVSFESQGFSFGPIRAERTTDLRPGRNRHVLRYRLEGVTILGGSVGGTLNGHGGVLLLQWQTGH